MNFIASKPRLTKYLSYFLFFGLFLFFPVASLIARTPPREVRQSFPLRVGVYQYQPLIQRSEQGQVRGIIPEMMEYVAERENWEIEYFFGTWSESLNRLENGELDVMLGIGHSEMRARKFDYNSRAFVSDWARIYVPESARIETFSDLKGKRVGVLKRDIFYDEGSEGLKKLMARFDFSCTFVEYNKYREIFIDLQAGELEAGAFGRMVGRRLDQTLDNRNRVKAAPINYSPYKMLAAFPRDREINSYLINRIDHNLKQMKQGPDSFYSRIHQKYHLERPARGEIPNWLWYLLGGLGGLVLLFFGGIYLLRRQVRTQTAEIRKINRSLQMLSQCNQMLVRVTDEAQLYRRICEIIVETAGYRMAWIGSRQEDQLEIIARRGETDDYLETVLGDSPVQLSSVPGPVKKALQRGAVQVCENLEANSSAPAWQQEASRRNYASTIVLPLKLRNEVFGVLNIYSDEPDAFRSREIDLLQDLAADVSFGIRVLRTREQRRETREELEKSLEEKEILLKEVHHRVKNNLFTITSLLEMQKLKEDNSVTRQVLQQAIDRIHSMALLHRKIYAQDILRNVKMDEYLCELIEEQIQAHTEPGSAPEFNCSAASETVNFDHLIPVGLVVTELVANALEHGFTDPGEGEIRVEFEKTDSTYRLVLKHSGQGLPADFELEKDAGLGLQLVKKLIGSQLRGELELKTGEPAKFIISWPVS